MDSAGIAQTKKDLLERLLEKGMVMVHLDARQGGVKVPGDLKDESDLRLNLSYRFRGGLEVDMDSVRATLSFSGHPYPCEVPLVSVFAMVSHVTGEGFFFPSDAPAEALAALAEMVSESESESDGDSEAPAAPEPPALRAVDGGRSADDTFEAEAEDESEPGARTPHLRVVK